MTLQSDVRDLPLLIGGKRVLPPTEQWLSVEDPYSRDVWARVPVATAEEVAGAVEAARVAFESWSSLSPGRRSDILRAVADRIEDNVDELTRLQVRENGKAIREQHAQTSSLGAYLRFFASAAEQARGATIPVSAPDTLCYTRREPIGVVAALTPWNSPLSLLMWKLAPALATGNTMVVKPSEVAPVSALILAELAEEAGLPPGVVNVVTGAGDVGAMLVEHPGVDKVAFTGSTAAGRAVGRSAMDHLARVSLELGGKSANIVFADADLARAVDGVVGGIFAAAGQTCIAGSRVLVEESIYAEFSRRLVERVRTIRLGNPMDWETEVGTIACPAQLDKVTGYVALAEAEGARLLCGGGPPPGTGLGRGLFFEPTVFADVHNDMRIAREEVFGPVVVLQRFRDERDAVEQANASEFGLAAGVWSANGSRAHRVAAQLRAGTVWVNTYRKLHHAVPFGGVKQSGFGRENGLEALDEYTQVKAVWTDLGETRSDPFNPLR